MRIKESFFVLVICVFVLYGACSSPSNQLDLNGKEPLQAQAEQVLQPIGNASPFPHTVPWNEICVEENFCWQHPRPLTKESLLFGKIWDTLAFPDGTWWFVGEQQPMGIILKSKDQGHSWKTISSADSLYRIAGSHSNDVWISSATHIIHCKEDSCENIPIPASTPSFIQKLFVSEKNDVWISTTNQLFHYDPNTNKFIAFSLDSFMTYQPYEIVGLWGSSKNDIWILVAPHQVITKPNGNTLDFARGNIISSHFNGTTLTTPVEIFKEGSLYHSYELGGTGSIQFLGLAQNDMWLIGYVLQKDKSIAIQFSHYDGTNFSPLQIPDPFVSANQIIEIRSYNQKLWALDTNSSLIAWNGTQWEAPILSKIGNNLYWLNKNNEIFTLPKTNFPNELFLTKSNPGPMLPFQTFGQITTLTQRIVDFWPVSQNEAWLLSDSNWFRWKDNQLHAYSLPTDITAKTSTGPSDIWFGGKNIIYHFNGSTLKPYRPKVGSSFEFTITSLWSVTPSNVWATTATGNILHFDGSMWTVIANTTEPFQQVFAADANDVWFVGKNTLFHFNGTHFEWREPFAKNIVALSIWRVNSQNVWAIADGITYRYDGNQFRVYNNFFGENALSIWGNQPNEIWVTTTTKLIRGDGETWKQVMTLPSPFKSTWKIVGTTDDPYPWMFFTNSNLLLRRKGI